MKNKDYYIRNISTFIKRELSSLKKLFFESKRFKFVILIAFLLISIQLGKIYIPKISDYYQVKNFDKWQTYENKRYSFSVKYPSSWIAGRESDNQDGTSLYTNKSDVEIKVYASTVMYGIKPPYFNWDTPGSTMDDLTLVDGNPATLISGKMGDKYFIDMVIVRDKIEYHYFAKVSPTFYKENKNTLLKSAKSILTIDPSLNPENSLDSSYYENLIKKDLQVIIKKPDSVDLTGDGKPEMIYVTAGEGCGSCHGQTIRIFDDQKEIFSIPSDDPIFMEHSGSSFAVFQPIRKDNEPLCCPTTFSAKTYIWNGTSFDEQNILNNSDSLYQKI